MIVIDILAQNVHFIVFVRKKYPCCQTWQFFKVCALESPIVQYQHLTHPLSPLCQPMSPFTNHPPPFGLWNFLWTGPDQDIFFIKLVYVTWFLPCLFLGDARRARHKSVTILHFAHYYNMFVRIHIMRLNSKLFSERKSHKIEPLKSCPEAINSLY